MEIQEHMQHFAAVYSCLPSVFNVVMCCVTAEREKHSVCYDHNLSLLRNKNIG